MSRIILDAAPDKKINKQYLKISLKSFLKFRLSFGLIIINE
jgi:hypothetical protein